VEILQELQDVGIENVLALRGDPPRGETEWKPHPGGLTYSVELIRLVRERFDFSIGAACFPEVHPEAPDRETDLRYAREKVEAGAGFLVTQLFLDNEIYFEFVEHAREAGIDVPIIPGIMPITNVRQVIRFAELSGAALPKSVTERINEVADDDDQVRRVGIQIGIELSEELLSRGSPGLHFFTQNRSRATREIYANLHSVRRRA